MSAVAIKISPTLADQARAAAEDADRSMAGQVEHWAKLGRAVESKLPVASIAALKKAGASEEPIDWAAENAKALQILRDFAENPDRTAVKEFIGVGKRVLYAADPTDPEGVVQVLPDGTRIPGTMVNRKFIPKTT